MFEIEYKGGNGVVISTKKATLAVDTKLSLDGLNDLAIKDAIELATEERFVSSNKTAHLQLEGPGDYEVKDFSIRGKAAQRHLDGDATEKLSTVYRVEVGDVVIAILGNIAPKLTEDQLETLGVVDILITPIGGNGYTLDATSAAGMVRQIDPRVVVPIHYADSGLKYEVPQDTLEVFVKELSAPVETVSKYKVKSAAALPESLTVVEIQRS